MNITINSATMTFTKEDGYVGMVVFSVEGHSHRYEMALQKSQSAKTWAYGLFFHNGSGKEDEILAVEDELEENDELYDRLVEAAENAYKEAEAANKA